MTVPPSYFGHMVPGYIVAADGTTTSPITIPIGLLRLWDTGAVWYYIAANEPLSWTGFDGFLTLAKNLEAEVMYVFGRAPEAECLPGTMVPTLSAWTLFVQAVIERAQGRIKYWELWNEPAVASLYWAGGTVGELYERSAIAHGLIKAAVPNAVVLTPSFNDLPEHYSAVFVRAYLERMRNYGNAADAIAFHSYGDAVSDLKLLKSHMAANRIDLPIYLTETVATPTVLAALAGKVGSVVHNAQIEGEDDLDASSGKGLAWAQAYKDLTKPLSLWKRILRLLHLG
ncbi:MAG: glycoside hydrolase family 44 protein [Gemmatimonadota bacterium]|nr:glycoside hydrolase family 44 protein [Gemmatimonadota bacterium]